MHHERPPSSGPASRRRNVLETGSHDIERPARFPSFTTAGPHVMQQRIYAGLRNVGVCVQVVADVEFSTWVAAFFPAGQEKIIQRVFVRFPQFRI